MSLYEDRFYQTQLIFRLLQHLRARYLSIFNTEHLGGYIYQVKYFCEPNRCHDYISNLILSHFEFLLIGEFNRREIDRSKNVISIIVIILALPDASPGM